VATEDETIDTAAKDPAYGSLDDVPLRGPGAPGSAPLEYVADLYDDPVDLSFTSTEKHRALDNAAAVLEVRVNDGNPINNPEQIHHLLANLYATYSLMHDMGHVASTRRGEADAGPEGIREYAEDFKAEFDELVEDVLAATGDESDAGRDGVADDGDDAQPGANLHSPTVVSRR